MNMRKISVIIPCYNEEAVITETHKRLSAVMQSLLCGYELLYVNDGSGDNRLIILSPIAATDPCVKVLEMLNQYMDGFLQLQLLFFLAASNCSRPAYLGSMSGIFLTNRKTGRNILLIKK